MESVFELQRRYHEERERGFIAMAKEMMHEKKLVKEQIISDHKVSILLQSYLTSTTKLSELYRDKSRVEERITVSAPNDFSEFYNRLKNIKEYHRKNPNKTFTPISAEFTETEKIRENGVKDFSENIVNFCDEEGFGRFLDLHECHNQYINLNEVVDYVTYLRTFDRLFAIPKERKFGKPYQHYTRTLLDYLNGYLFRVRPLIDHVQNFETVKNQFETNWADQKFPGWEKVTVGALSFSGARLDLNEFSSVEELEALGGDRLKSALKAIGLKCGGTVSERAGRLLSTKGKEEIPSSLFTKDRRMDSRAGESEARAVAWTEAQIYAVCEQLSEQRHATIENIQRKQAQTCSVDDHSEPEEEREEDDKEEAGLYNPKNVPLGWDGKPIPYWLYKLHGLNLSYPCEICGNYVYRGPKAFQMHFAEWRHAYGMRCLGIPNTSHFANVTKIEDAIELWTKIKIQKELDRWKAEVEEEFEDNTGNVVLRKTYDDLKRQGLL